MLQTKMGRRIGAGVAGLALLAFAAPVALGHTSTTPKLIGSPTAGKSAFATTCAACHTLKAAGAVGTLGPNLDKTANTLTEAKIITAISKGGASIMTKAAIAKYPTTMQPYASLGTKTVDNIAAFVYTSTHKA